jgi:hypothetical protein
MAWTDDLAKFLRLDSGEKPYVGYPQMQVGLTKPRQTGYATGFLENATGLPPMQSQGVLTNPNYESYAQGQNAGELANIGAMAIPGYAMALKASAPKAYNALENYMVKSGGMMNMIEDGSGKPLTLYHGTKSDIEEFIPSKGGEYGGGIYFGETPSQASFFAKNAKGIEGENIIPVNLDIKNPLNVTAYERDKVRSKSIKQLEKKGYDGIVATGLTGEKQYIAFRPEQVISTITKKPMTRKEILAEELNKKD